MIMQAFESRKAIDLTMFHCAALMLYPRPDLCRKASQYIGCVEDNNLGNTPVVRKAVEALGVLAKVVRGTKRDGLQLVHVRALGNHVGTVRVTCACQTCTEAVEVV
jgi:hypothetical protein